MNDLVLLANRLLMMSWLFVLAGVIHALVIEYRAVAVLIEQRKPKKAKDRAAAWRSIAKRLAYVAGGLVVMLMAWQFALTLFETIMPANLSSIDLKKITELNALTLPKFHLGLLGVITTYGFLLSGVFLTVSAGSRWLVTTAKLITTATVLYAVLTMFFAYMPAK